MITLITGNTNKVREFEEILGVEVDSKKLDIEEIQAIDVEKVAEYKARKAYEILRKPVMVDDTGLYFNAWKGLPGAFIRFFLDNLTKQEICNLLKEDRKAIAKTTICYFNGKDLKTFTGEIEGTIALAPRGETDFGFDDIFIIKGETMTFAESGQKKNEVSMRKLALEKLKCIL
jgi:XTP/dITP diphosphohydrolase